MNASAAFRCFFSLMFGGSLPADVAQAYGYAKAQGTKSVATPASTPVSAPTATPAAPPKPQPSANDGAVQILGALQRDSRLIDFLMEDIAAYTDDQVGAAVRDVHTQAKQSLARYLKLQPVIDAVEETTVATTGLESAAYKLIGNVPANGKAASGLLRHRGWKAAHMELPTGKLGTTIIAPAELEIE
jgi:hypothetical protein